MPTAPKSRLLLRGSAEFAVIVVGVLAAFAVEDWAGDRADRRVEVQYLASLAQDLRNDSTLLADLHLPNRARSVTLLEGIAPVSRGDSSLPRDTVDFLHGVAESFRTPFLRPGPTYEELLATGSLRLVESNQLRAAIVGYYQFQSVAATRDETAGSGYREVVRSHLPTSTSVLSEEAWKAVLHDFGIERAASAVVNTDFAEAVNRHLNYWVSMGPTLEDLFQRTIDLLDLIEAEIVRLS